MPRKSSATAAAAAASVTVSALRSRDVLVAIAQGLLFGLVALSFEFARTGRVPSFRSEPTSGKPILRPGQSGILDGGSGTDILAYWRVFAPPSPDALSSPAGQQLLAAADFVVSQGRHFLLPGAGSMVLQAGRGVTPLPPFFAELGTNVLAVVDEGDAESIAGVEAAVQATQPGERDRVVLYTSKLPDLSAVDSGSVDLAYILPGGLTSLDASSRKALAKELRRVLRPPTQQELALRTAQVAGAADAVAPGGGALLLCDLQGGGADGLDGFRGKFAPVPSSGPVGRKGLRARSLADAHADDAETAASGPVVLFDSSQADGTRAPCAILRPRLKLPAAAAVAGGGAGADAANSA